MRLHETVRRRFERNQAATAFVAAISTGIIASLILAIAQSFDAQALGFLVVIVAQTAVATLLALEIRHLASFIDSAIAPRKDPTNPLAAVADDAVRSFRSYGFIASHRHAEAISEMLREGQYLRGQNFLYLLKSGFIECETRLRYINDHPFAPFAEALYQTLHAQVDVVGIGAVPDAMYEAVDLQARIAFASRPNVTYYLMHPSDVHISMLLFDDRFGLVYSTPVGRTVCNYSEALFLSDPATIRQLLSMYDGILKLAVRRQAQLNTTAVQEMQRLLRLRIDSQRPPA